MIYDAAVIGAGIMGTSAARFLSRYSGKFCVIEKNEDVCTGTSKANSAIVHAGFDAEPGSLKARYNLLGSLMYPELSKELAIPFRRNGSLVVMMHEEDRPKLMELYERGLANGVQELEIIEAERLRELEPHISPNAVAALWAPTGGIVCPFLATVALAENAADNGVDFFFNTEVNALCRINSALIPDSGGQKNKSGFLWEINTSRGAVYARAVVNAAGVMSDIYHNLVSEHKIRIIPRKGEYLLLDRQTGGYVERTIFQLPGKLGKGVLVSPTIHGNTLVGPTAMEQFDREAVHTTSDGMNELMEKAGDTVKGIPFREVITSFAGVRAHEVSGDFILGEPADAPFFYDCAGIESPGLTAAPAIGKQAAEDLAEMLGLPENPSWIRTRKGIPRPSEMSPEEYRELIRTNPDYGRIVCRCETVTEGEIREAIRRKVGARSLDGVKRRVRAGMGRCQSGFCSPRVMEILSEELGIPVSEITKKGGYSRIIADKIKSRSEEENR